MKALEGIQSFSNSIFPTMHEQFEQLESGQSPETLFITCSDSRIVPNLITQTGPGDLFVIRNAGNIVPPPGVGELAIEATIQYAVDVLCVSNIVVCGHSHCGAMSGLLNLDSLNSMPAIREWVQRSQGVLERIGEQPELPKAVDANVLLQLEHLRQYECVQQAIESGQLNLHGWVYHFEAGRVDILHSDSESVVGTNEATGV